MNLLFKTYTLSPAHKHARNVKKSKSSFSTVEYNLGALSHITVLRHSGILASAMKVDINH